MIPKQKQIWFTRQKVEILYTSTSNTKDRQTDSIRAYSTKYDRDFTVYVSNGTVWLDKFSQSLIPKDFVVYKNCSSGVIFIDEEIDFLFKFDYQGEDDENS